jgi:hypothetical protein
VAKRRQVNRIGPKAERGHSVASGSRRTAARHYCRCFTSSAPVGTIRAANERIEAAGRARAHSRR